MANDPPSVVVIGGPNGAGKSTSARTILAETLKLMTYVNADTIAQGLAAFDPESAAVEAGRVMLERLRNLAEERADFAFETTLAGRFFATWLQSLRETGYQVHVVYCWLESADLAVQRVAQRVQNGGHHVPEATIRQRYRRSMINFLHLYRPVVHTWQVYDNTRLGLPSLVAEGDHTGRETVINAEVWQQLLAGVGS